VTPWSATGKDGTMPPAGSAILNVQPRQRRAVYEALAKLPEGGSVKDLLEALDIPEYELRETLRMLDRAGLVRRTRATWSAIPLEPPNGEPPTAALA
jgi:Helix-turn-helix domain